MKEVLLHQIWQSQNFDKSNLHTEQGEKLTVYHPGLYLQQSGPDFFNAQLEIGNQRWAGNIEIHIKASDWYAHHHESDDAYDNVILHVVWESDIPVFYADQTPIPVLILKDYIDQSLLDRYQKLFERKPWIYCENQIPEWDLIKELNWKERLYIERLNLKTKPILEIIHETKNHWEQVFFSCLARGFGLNTNGVSFEKWSKQIPVNVIFKYFDNLFALEALFLGGTGLLNREIQDSYGRKMQDEWRFLKYKYQLLELSKSEVQFFKLRPDNFPTIRLVQLASWVHKNKNGLYLVLEAKRIDELYKLFDVGVSEYWKTHFVFDKESSQHSKKLSKKFIDLLILNTIIPFMYTYYSLKKMDYTEILFDILRELKPETNQIITNFKKNGFIIKDALDSQALLQLKKYYCDRKKCLNCLVGRTILYG